jgi:hypothetical protein
MPNVVALTVACLLQAAAHQSIPAPIMFGLYNTEGGSVGSSSPNTDGSHDLGPMQINDNAWLGKIADLQFRGDKKAARQAIQFDGCYNVEVSAWIFHQYLIEANGDFAVAVGHYNSHNPEPMARYQALFAKKYLELYGDQLAGRPAAPASKNTAPVPAARQQGSVDAYLSGNVAAPRQTP